MEVLRKCRRLTMIFPLAYVAVHYDDGDGTTGTVRKEHWINRTWSGRAARSGVDVKPSERHDCWSPHTALLVPRYTAMQIPN
jgi:hypothetical protein